MRTYYLLPFVGVLAVLPLLYFLFPRPNDTESVNGFEEWRPTTDDITKTVGKIGPGHFDDTRHEQFCRLFKKRFRDHQVAVGVRFLNDTTLKVMCAAVVPRWDMARVGVEARHVAKEVFGQDYDVDIYETYISASQRKMAEVRAPPPGGPVVVRFDSRFAKEGRKARGGEDWMLPDFARWVWQSVQRGMYNPAMLRRGPGFASERAMHIMVAAPHRPTE